MCLCVDSISHIGLTKKLSMDSINSSLQNDGLGHSEHDVKQRQKTKSSFLNILCLSLEKTKKAETILIILYKRALLEAIINKVLSG